MMRYMYLYESIKIYLSIMFTWTSFFLRFMTYNRMEFEYILKCRQTVLERRNANCRSDVILTHKKVSFGPIFVYSILHIKLRILYY